MPEPGQSRNHTALVRGLAGKHQDAEAITELEWAEPRLQVMSPQNHQALGNVRLALADALWRRAQSGDRDKARVLASAARDESLAYRAGLDPDDPRTPMYTRIAQNQLARIEAWRAAHR